jgi:hypothetical protein
VIWGSSRPLPSGEEGGFNHLFLSGFQIELNFLLTQFIVHSKGSDLIAGINKRQFGVMYFETK